MKVIAGTLKGRSLKTLKTANTRPTAAKIRGAIFNTLGQYFTPEMKVLDLFAGSGALAIEALSRGSGFAIAVEHQRAAYKIIQANRAHLQLTEQLTIYCGDYQKYLQTTTERFDLVFIDPPYALKVSADIVALLFERQLLRPKARIVLEIAHESEQSTQRPFWADYHVIFNRIYGITQIIIIENNKGENYE